MNKKNSFQKNFPEKGTRRRERYSGKRDQETGEILRKKEPGDGRDTQEKGTRRRKRYSGKGTKCHETEILPKK
jgi:hypothetical protein